MPMPFPAHCILHGAVEWSAVDVDTVIFGLWLSQRQGESARAEG
jgi:hypothetical protein